MEAGSIQQNEPEERDNAVIAEDVYHDYGRHIPVLQGLNMTVPRGAIYGLLGPSGCGKTTLLRCIIGRLKVKKGNIVTLGKVPGSRGHQVPGCQVGYMPQELALYNEFTIGETLSYFGRLHKMKSEEVKQRTKFLLEFLHLPEKERQIVKLSGGQQRRTSFAIALLQEPELLILDEPTVGVDPLLRQRIWEHLLYVAQHSNCTIIITTHYVEEARQAHYVGLMRNGRLLAEAPPQTLMEQHGIESLEEVFLTLCEKDQIGDIEEAETNKTSTSINTTSVVDDEQPLLLTEPVVTQSKPHCCSGIGYYVPSFWNIIALCIKNFIILRRQIGFLLFEFFLPAFQIILFCTCVGKIPYDLPMAIVNAETNGTCPGYRQFLVASCGFLSFLDNRTIIQQNFSNDFSAAEESVREGKSWGIIEFREHFTEDLAKRMDPNSDLDNATIEGGEVHIYLDNTNQQISYTLQLSLLNSFRDFLEYTLISLHKNPALASIPLKIEDPIYGKVNPTFLDFMAPGVILSITFFMATGLTALSFVLEKKQGLLDRSFVAGVSPIEVMVGHIVTQFVVMLIQVAILLIFAIAIFEITVAGSFFWVIVLTLLQGLTGMALGFLISTVSEEETSAIQLSLGSVYPNMLLSGIIWPIEAMPVWLRYISYCLPMTYATEAMRGIMGRGWGMLSLHVWRGFLVTIGWGFGLMVLSGIVLKIKTRQ